MLYSLLHPTLHCCWESCWRKKRSNGTLYIKKYTSLIACAESHTCPLKQTLYQDETFAKYQSKVITVIFSLKWAGNGTMVHRNSTCYVLGCCLPTFYLEGFVFSTFWNTCMRSDVNPMAAPNTSAVFPVKVQFSKWAKLLRWPSGPISMKQKAIS